MRVEVKPGLLTLKTGSRMRPQNYDALPMRQKKTKHASPTMGLYLIGDGLKMEQTLYSEMRSAPC